MPPAAAGLGAAGAARRGREHGAGSTSTRFEGCHRGHVAACRPRRTTSKFGTGESGGSGAPGPRFSLPGSRGREAVRRLAGSVRLAGAAAVRVEIRRGQGRAVAPRRLGEQTGLDAGAPRTVYQKRSCRRRPEPARVMAARGVTGPGTRARSRLGCWLAQSGQRGCRRSAGARVAGAERERSTGTSRPGSRRPE